ncbi:unnamed protein product [Caenorhabditis brenneri]
MDGNIKINRDDKVYIGGKVLLCCLTELIGTKIFGTYFLNNGRWLCLLQVGSSVLNDLVGTFMVHGTTRNTFQAIFFSGAFLLGFNMGNFAGNSLGNLCPSVTGKWCGILFGMLFGYFCGTKTEDVVSNIADRYDYDVESRNCKDCQAPFTYRRYERGYANYCGKCRQVPPSLKAEEIQLDEEGNQTFTPGTHCDFKVAISTRPTERFVCRSLFSRRFSFERRRPCYRHSSPFRLTQYYKMVVDIKIYADDKLYIGGKVLFCYLTELIGTKIFGTYFLNNGRWLCLYETRTSVLTDFFRGTTRNTFQAVFFSGGFLLGCKLGNFAGNSLGNLCSNATGKWSGILVGMLFGYFCGTKTVDVVSNIADRYDYDVESRNCKDCQAPFTYRRYEYGWADYCGNCRQVTPLIQFQGQWKWNR